MGSRFSCKTCHCDHKSQAHLARTWILSVPRLGGSLPLDLTVLWVLEPTFRQGVSTGAHVMNPTVAFAGLAAEPTAPRHDPHSATIKHRLELCK